MCDFHSICVNKAGAIAHIPANSHSGAVADAGWPENTNVRTNFVECEWDGRGEYSLERVVSLRNGLKIEDLTNKQVASIERHYKALANVMAGDLTAIFPGGSLHGLQYWDVYLAAMRSDSIKPEDRDRIQRELLTATAGYEGTATAGYKGTATAGNKGTATAGDKGTATAGNYGTATAGDYGTATAGNYGTATAGYEGTATAGDYGTATAGYEGTATAGYEGTATAGNYGTATAGDKGTATAGDKGALIIEFYDKKSESWKRRLALVDGQKIKPNVPYRLNEAGEFVEVTE